MVIAPWNATQWVNCHGSVLMQTLYPTPPGEQSEAQLEGKAFHYVIAKILTAWRDVNESIPTMRNLVGEVTPHDVVIDETMAQAAIDYVTNIMGYVNDHGLLRQMQIEERIDLSVILGDGKYGIPDTLIWDPKRAELFIGDAKYGQRKVEAFENFQMIIYALAYIDTVLKANGLMDQNITVRMRIYQPRYYDVEGPCREWVVKASDLRGYRNQIDNALHAINGDSPTCKPGPWCRANHCSAAHVCESLQTSMYNYLDHITHALPVELDPAALSAEYLILKEAEERLKARKTAIEEQCIGLITRGNNLPGLATKQGYGRERWKKDVPHDEIIMMGDLLGEDIRKPAQLDTPAQCRKKGIDDAVIALYSETPKTAIKLVKDDGSKARQVFR